MSKETGGPASPAPYSSHSSGQTLRDHFAGLAMASIVRRYDGHSFGGGPGSPQYRELAEDAYHIADAMLDARGE